MTHNRARESSQDGPIPAEPAPAREGGSGSDRPRRACLGLLRLVLEDGRSFDRVFAEACAGDGRLAALRERDRAFVRAVCMSVLRHLRLIDRAIADRVARPLRPGKAASPAIGALRLGAAQILFLDVPDHAAVHSSVALLPPNSAFRGLVNAVLRRIAAEKEEILATETAAMALPDWLWQSWRAAFGAERAAALSAASLAEAPLDITVKGESGAWTGPLEAEALPGGSLRRPSGGRVESLPGFAEGAWWVQDAAAAVPARILADALRPGRDGADALSGCRVLEMCAAPGGKTAQLAAMGAAVTALEQDPQRVARMTGNLRRLGLAVEAVTTDATAWPDDRTFEGVLLDAPCSATGTLRRHPDILHLRRPGDLVATAALQDRLLDAAIARLQPGGALLYCVCSLQPQEGGERIAAALSRHGDMAQVPLQAAAYGLPPEAQAGAALLTAPDLWPALGGLDGFFMALLRRAG